MESPDCSAEVIPAKPLMKRFAPLARVYQMALTFFTSPVLFWLQWAKPYGTLNRQSKIAEIAKGTVK
jgi:hypothetical protein